jgi:hypothetical protein
MLVNALRTLITVFLITISSQVAAEEKRYSSKDCSGISMGIDYLLSLTSDIWDKLKEDPDDDEVAMELSWVVDLAADYTVIYEAFCEDEK